MVRTRRGDILIVAGKGRAISADEITLISDLFDDCQVYQLPAGGHWLSDAELKTMVAGERKTRDS